MDAVRVEVDNREDPVFQSILSGFSKEDNIEFESKQLSVGDVIVWAKRPILIERKTFPDLLMSIKDGRFKKQLRNMQEQDTFDRFLVFKNCCKINILEKSIYLKKIQKQTLKNRNIKWLKNIVLSDKEII